MIDNVCRICLGEAFPQQPLNQRCGCAKYHDECFIQFIKHRKKSKCEICNQSYRGLILSKKEINIASFKKHLQAIIIISFCFIIVSWINYSSTEDIYLCMQRYKYDKVYNIVDDCVVQLNSVRYLFFIIFLNESIIWLILFFINSFFRDQVGIDVYQTIHSVSLDENYSTVITGEQYLELEEENISSSLQDIENDNIQNNNIEVNNEMVSREQYTTVVTNQVRTV